VWALVDEPLKAQFQKTRLWKSLSEITIVDAGILLAECGTTSSFGVLPAFIAAAFHDFYRQADDS
jgi:hypothetical protein